MPRKTISEFRAKQIVNNALGSRYQGWEVDTEQAIAPQLRAVRGTDFVVKVDQAVKGRFKKGLVLLNVAKNKLESAAQELKNKGYKWLLVEPMVGHKPDDERYISLSRNRSGITMLYSAKGGVNVEQHGGLRSLVIDDPTKLEPAAKASGLRETLLSALVETFINNHFVFMEINPYLLDASGDLQPLDLAVEVDDAAIWLTNSWGEVDFRSPQAKRTPEEDTIAQLAKKSPAAFSFDVLNPDGSIFLLLSGGGASVTIADEVYNLGYGKQLANYGEYSGNPNTEETYIYTRAVLQALLKSKAPKKVIFVGGAVANFTDIRATFTGLIQAIDEMAPQLKKHKLKVFVRRGGPREEEGLKAMSAALIKHGLFGAVHDASTPIATAVGEMLKEVKR